jgi:hypothetical protein
VSFLANHIVHIVYLPPTLSRVAARIWRWCPERVGACGTLQVGAAANAAAEAVRLVDKLRARLRAGAAEVAGAQSWPRVMVLESLQPLRIGDAPTWAVTTDVLADPREIA